MVGDEVLPGAVALDDGGHHLLRHIGIVGEKLLGVLGKTVASVAEGGVIVVGTDARVEAYAVDNGLRVEALDLGVGVKFVEVADAEGEVGVGKELDGLGFLHAHVKGGYVLLDGALLEKGGEDVGLLVHKRGVGE